MKIRIGYGLGAQRGLTADRFNSLVDTLEALKFDSLWLSELVGAPNSEKGRRLVRGWRARHAFASVSVANLLRARLPRSPRGTVAS